MLSQFPFWCLDGGVVLLRNLLLGIMNTSWTFNNELAMSVYVYTFKAISQLYQAVYTCQYSGPIVNLIVSVKSKAVFY